MKNSILRSLILSVVFSAVFTGCSADNTNSPNAVAKNDAAPNGTATNSNVVAPRTEYPQPVADEFLKSCENAGSTPEFCECVFEKVKQEYTFEEFSVIDSKLNAGQPPADFVEFSGKARAACTK